MASSPEPEWDEEQVEWMDALAEYEAGLCPLCGAPRDVCQSPDTEGRVDVPAPTRCHVTTAIRAASKAYEKNDHPDALNFVANIRG